jgi:hypothetical protein
MAAAAVTAACGLRYLRLPQGHDRDTALALSLIAPTTVAGMLTCERLIGATHWWELLADAAWTAVIWWTRPARLARHLADHARTSELVPAVVAVPDEHPMAVWWATHLTAEKGAAPGTVLEDIESVGPRAIRAIIRSIVPGQPVPNISTVALSALLDWPEDEIAIAPVPGRGAGVRQLTVGHTPEQAAADPIEVWTSQIAPKAMPNTVITAIRTIDQSKELA